MLPGMSKSGTRLLVLGYHNIESTWRFPVDGSGMKKFARQMRILKRIANVVPLDAALQAIQAGRPLPPRAVAITMDDGYRDNLTSAVPIINRLAIPATIYLVPGFLSGAVRAWWEELAWAVGHARACVLNYGERQFELSSSTARAAALRDVESSLKQLDHTTRLAKVEDLVTALDPAGDFRGEELFLNWDGARDLVRAGIAIGSHTMQHAILAREGEAEQRVDLQMSRRVLEDELRVPVRTLAYPNGTCADYNEGTLRAASDAGYSHAVTTWGAAVGAATPAYEVSRRMVDTECPGIRFASRVLRMLAD